MEVSGSQTSQCKPIENTEMYDNFFYDSFFASAFFSPTVVDVSLIHVSCWFFSLRVGVRGGGKRIRNLNHKKLTVSCYKKKTSLGDSESVKVQRALAAEKCKALCRKLSGKLSLAHSLVTASAKKHYLLHNHSSRGARKT